MGRVVIISPSHLLSVSALVAIVLSRRERAQAAWPLRFALSLLFTSPHLAALRVVAVFSSVLACCFARCCSVVRLRTLLPVVDCPLRSIPLASPPACCCRCWLFHVASRTSLVLLCPRSSLLVRPLTTGLDCSFCQRQCVTRSLRRIGPLPSSPRACGFVPAAISAELLSD